MADNQSKQQNAQQRALAAEESALKRKMEAVEHELALVVALRPQNDLGDTVIQQVWRKSGQPDLLQALALDKLPDNGRRRGLLNKQAWKRHGKPVMFARLEGLNCTDDGPILYLCSDDSLWLQQANNYPLWHLSSWHHRSGAPIKNQLVESSLDRLYDRLQSYAHQLEPQTSPN